MAKLEATAAVSANALAALVKLLGSVTSASITGLNGKAPPGADGFILKSGTEQVTVTGTGFSYLPVVSVPLAGNIAGLEYSSGGKLQYKLTELTLKVADAPKLLTNPLLVFSGDDTLIGSAFADTLNAGGGFSNTVRGGGGNDTLEGGVSGTNTADYSDKKANEGISVTLSPTAAVKVKVGASEVDTINHFQNITGGAGGDVMNGDFRDNVFLGNAGNDKLFGGAGDDGLRGGAGDDVIKPGLSRLYGDTIDGGLGNDTADFSDMMGAVVLNLGVKRTDVTYWSDAFVGGKFAGYAGGIENIVGGAGDDKLTGDAGANRLTGGAGSDTLNGGGGIDLASFSDKTAGVTITLKDGAELKVVLGKETDTLIAIESLEGGKGNDAFNGDKQSNTLYGRNGTDVLRGGEGNDTLWGGQGNDLLTGGNLTDRLKADKFVFDLAPSVANGFDTITDFGVADDRIRLQIEDFSALAGPKDTAVTANELFIGTKATGLAARTVDQHLIYDKGTGELFYDADGRGAGAMIKFAVLQGSPDNLSATSFELFV